MQSNKKKSFKGQLGMMPEAAITVVVIIAVVALGVILLVGFNDSTTNTDAQEVISSGVSALKTFGDWMPTIVIAVIFVIVLGVILMLRNRTGGI